MKKYAKDMRNYVKGAMTMGVGSAVLGGMGSYGDSGASMIGKAAPMMGVLGVASGASAVMRALPKQKGRKRRY